MKLIKQSFEILEQKDFSLIGIKKFIERCGRVCYKSEDRITDDSYEKFVNMLVKRDHARPLEFGTVHLKISSGMLFEEFLQDLVDCKLYNPAWIKYKELPEYTYITTNYRHYLQIIKKCPYIAEYFTEQDNCYYPSRYTVHMVLSRGIMDEFRTHVGLSHLAESTRYCNYSKDKFDNQVTFVIPNWCNSLKEGSEQNYPPFEINEDEIIFMDALQNAQNSYLSLLKLGWTPQQAREVLPLSVKSELISCGFKDAWENFFYRRCANDAHPMAREIAIPLQKRFKELGYDNQ
jgi:thymidylate synthase (FAD)